MTTTRISQRALAAAKSAIPGALRTAWWMMRLTVMASFGVELLRCSGALNWMSGSLSPVFGLLGLPGEAALAFMSGYFINVYAAVAVIDTLNFDTRTVTILAVMVLCAHNMIIESPVQQKCGSSLLRIFLVRTLGALALGFCLHLLLPGSPDTDLAHNTLVMPGTLPLTDILEKWTISTTLLIVKMVTLIVSLSVLQRLLAEFGVIRLLSKLLRPLLVVFGLPARTSFLWIVANVLGLAYGAAIMIEETERGKINRGDADLLNHHIGVSHSNLEDILLLYSAGALFWWMLLSRWGLAIVLVWERRLENVLKHMVKVIKNQKNC
ncbi:MAG: nucleoside recognition protein [Prevotellaceae bacterium]|jgi:spore maturation protein SpmB|nr:nucleoside recognition protein [Prevotellaceae bacterium]